MACKACGTLNGVVLRQMKGSQVTYLMFHCKSQGACPRRGSLQYQCAFCTKAPYGRLNSLKYHDTACHAAARGATMVEPALPDDFGHSAQPLLDNSNVEIPPEDTELVVEDVEIQPESMERDRSNGEDDEIPLGDGDDDIDRADVNID